MPVMDFEHISYKSPLGRLLRLPLKLVRPDAKMPILSGRLRGKRWIASAGRNGCWLGTYEQGNQQHLATLLKPGDTFFDIGSHAGYFTLLGSTLVGDHGQVVAFEPLPRNLAYLQQHLAINQITNARLQAIALSDQTGTAKFIDNNTGYQGGLSQSGNIEVPTDSLDHLLAQGDIPSPQVIKMDVEGHEKFVLLGAANLFQKHHPTLFLSIHERTVFTQCCDILKGWGYAIEVFDQPIDGQLPKNLDLLAQWQP